MIRGLGGLRNNGTPKSGSILALPINMIKSFRTIFASRTPIIKNHTPLGKSIKSKNSTIYEEPKKILDFRDGTNFPYPRSIIILCPLNILAI